MIVCIGDAVSRRNREGNHFSTYDAVWRRDRALHSDSILQKLISTLCTCQTFKKDHVSSDEMTRQRPLTDAIFLISYIVLSCVMTRVILIKKNCLTVIILCIDHHDISFKVSENGKSSCQAYSAQLMSEPKWSTRWDQSDTPRTDTHDQRLYRTIDQRQIILNRKNWNDCNR